MTDTILVLTEDTLATTDVQNIVNLYGDEDLVFQVLVPADTEQNLLGAIFNHLGSGQFKEAWETATEGVPSGTEARAEASEQLATSIAEFEAAGYTASGSLVEEDPLPALRSAVAGGGVREVVVVTYPNIVEDTFHRDWASKAREELQVPVLHLYSGTSELG